jgi:predicted dithiol-disulfide oxidoreductase (DUF899 family)
MLPAFHLPQADPPQIQPTQKSRVIMNHPVKNRNEWLAARLNLLMEEKALTHHSDEVAKKRQELPWVKIDKDYKFETEKGEMHLKDLFQERSQLLVYHFMYGPDYKAGCPSCSSIADGFNGISVHLANHDVMLWAVSRAPIAKLQAYKQRMGWSFPWASSAQNDFNADFNVWFTEEQQRSGGVVYNYQAQPAIGNGPARGKNVEAWNDKGDESPMAQIAAMTGTDIPTYTRDLPGISAFIKEGNEVYHTYSSYSRGLDSLWGMYPWLDRAPKGRNENGIWWRRHDEYSSNS